jgi:hypothetical protein
MIVHLVSKQEVIEGRIDLIASAIKDCMNELLSTHSMTPLMFGIGGYDSDTRGLFEIPEVRSWCSQLYQKFPFIFAFLNSETIEWFFPCLADFEIVGRTNRRPQGWQKEFISHLNPDDQKTFADLVSTTTQVRYGSETRNFIEEICQHNERLLLTLKKHWHEAPSAYQPPLSEAEFDRLADEIGARIRKGIDSCFS